VSIEIEHFGWPGHFCAADSCRFHLHTHVGGAFCVSTVGDYYPRNSDVRDTLGAGAADFFETMAFPLDAVGDIANFDGLTQRRYATRDEANAGHFALVAEYVTQVAM
jgi:hypothetical protein